MSDIAIQVLDSRRNPLFGHILHIWIPKPLKISEIGIAMKGRKTHMNILNTYTLCLITTHLGV